jgi:hypothetical protein
MERYIILVGGSQYPTAIWPNQTITPSYGMPKMMCLDSDPPHPPSVRGIAGSAPLLSLPQDYFC